MKSIQGRCFQTQSPPWVTPQWRFSFKLGLFIGMNCSLKKPPALISQSVASFSDSPSWCTSNKLKPPARKEDTSRIPSKRKVHDFTSTPLHHIYLRTLHASFYPWHQGEDDVWNFQWDSVNAKDPKSCKKIMFFFFFLCRTSIKKPREMWLFLNCISIGRLKTMESI